jgi:hypothetical protein
MKQPLQQLGRSCLHQESLQSWMCGVCLSLVDQDLPEQAAQERGTFLVKIYIIDIKYI